MTGGVSSLALASCSSLTPLPCWWTGPRSNRGSTTQLWEVKTSPEWGRGVAIWEMYYVKMLSNVLESVITAELTFISFVFLLLRRSCYSFQIKFISLWPSAVIIPQSLYLLCALLHRYPWQPSGVCVQCSCFSNVSQRKILVTERMTICNETK